MRIRIREYRLIFLLRIQLVSFPTSNTRIVDLGVIKLQSGTVDARCMVVIDIKGKASTISWYEIWEETLAVVSMCVRGLGKGGKAISIGKYTCLIIA
jgi:hypothetical protein